MEYVAAETLDVALRHLAPAPIDRAWPILGHIAEAIDAGWAAGQGHGALHPRDVFVTPGTQDVRVSGFGVLHTLEQVGVKAPLRRPYTAPERVAGEPFDITADVYSLGAIAHELLTGRRPAGPGEQDGAMTSGTTPEQRVLIRKILSGALAERPRDRFATAGAFVAALRDVARGEPVGPLPVASQAVVETPVATEDTPPVPPPPVAPPVAPPKRTPRFSTSRTITPEWKDGKPVEPPLPLIVAAESDSTSVVDADVPVERAAVEVRAEPVEEAVAEPVAEPVATAPQPSAEVAAPSIWQPPPTQSRPAVESYSSYSVEPEPPPSYPWVAMIAIGIAGIVLGLVIGYRLGVNQAPPAPAPSAAAARPADTEVPVRPEPPPPPVVAPPSAPAVSAAPPPARAEVPEPAKPRQPAPTPAQNASKPVATGRLLVRSVPAGATISIDGHPHGLTPATVRDLTLGTHTIQVSKAGYLTKTESVTLTANDPARNLIVDLGPKRQLNR